MAKKSSPGTRQTDGKNLVWFGEIERKLAKLSTPALLLTVFPINYFMFLMKRRGGEERGLGPPFPTAGYINSYQYSR
jgi:hypothetical protein